MPYNMATYRRTGLCNGTERSAKDSGEFRLSTPGKINQTVCMSVYLLFPLYKYLYHG